jgi:hypothetical protein
VCKEQEDATRHNSYPLAMKESKSKLQSMGPGHDKTSCKASVLECREKPEHEQAPLKVERMYTFKHLVSSVTAELKVHKAADSSGHGFATQIGRRPGAPLRP